MTMDPVLKQHSDLYDLPNQLLSDFKESFKEIFGYDENITMGCRDRFHDISISGKQSLIQLYIYSNSSMFINHSQNVNLDYFKSMDQTKMIYILGNDLYEHCITRGIFYQQLNKITAMLEEIKEIQLYAPGGPLYEFAKTHFSSIQESLQD